LSRRNGRCRNQRRQVERPERPERNPQSPQRFAGLGIKQIN
jgi:hypothetical protein